MTSLELVNFINDMRTETKAAVLTHANFLKKVREVLEGREVNFYSTYSDSWNRDKPMYVFPKREATLLAMSYSHKISAQVYDRMDAFGLLAMYGANAPDRMHRTYQHPTVHLQDYWKGVFTPISNARTGHTVNYSKLCS